LLRPWDKHLDGNELDQLVSPCATAVAEKERLSEQAVEEARRHVEACQDCSRKVQMHKSVQNGISGMCVPRNLPPGADCLAYAEWLKVAAGIVSPDETRRQMVHAAQCGHCGPLLRQAAETLSDEGTDQENAILASLDSAQPVRQRQIAETLRRGRAMPVRPSSEVSWWHGFLFGWRPVLAAAALAVIVVAGWLGLRIARPFTPLQLAPQAGPSTNNELRLQAGPSTANELLAQAYTDHRTLEARIPGAKFASMQPVERAVGHGSNLDKSPALLTAEGMIGDQWKRDPAWALAKARADLLDGNYDAAVETLQGLYKQQLHNKAPASPELLRDLGTALLARAQAQSPHDDYAQELRRKRDFADAANYLRLALHEAPDDPIALFNGALACEALHFYHCAVENWTHYLVVDRTGGWAEEAQRRLDEVKPKLKREDHLTDPLLQPEQITDSVAVRRQIDKRLEEYLLAAITGWMPAAFPQPPSVQSRPAYNALVLLSDISKQEPHRDSWLADFLSHASDVQFAAIQALASAVKANAEGDYLGAHNAAQKAVVEFQNSGNHAGEVRARGEEAYSDQLLWEGEECVGLVKKVQHDLQGHDWTWLRGHMSLEQSNCSDQLGDIETYQTAILAGMKEAEAHHFTDLYLRGLGFESLALASMGDTEAALALAAKGLERFWSGQGVLMNGYNLYANMDPAADNLHLAGLQVLLWKEATDLIDRHPDKVLRAMAHLWYRKAAYDANMPDVAANEFAKAGLLLGRSEPTVATARDFMDAEVWMANVEIRRGDLETAAATLEKVKPIIATTRSLDPLIEYYSAQADIALRRSDSANSDAAIRSAVSLANVGLNSLHSERDRRQWAEQSKGAYVDAVEWKLRQGDAVAALELWEWYRGAEYGATEDKPLNAASDPAEIFPTSPEDAPPLPSPKMVSERLPLLREETVVVYAVLPDGVAVWIYDDRGISGRWLATESSKVEEFVAEYTRLCADPNSDLMTLLNTGRALYKALIGPIEDRLLPGRPVVFETDDFLDSVPWEALVTADGSYFVQRFAVVVSPGLYQSMHLRRAVAITSQTPALVVSVPTPERGVTSLPDADAEAQAVQDRFSAAHRLRDKYATLKEIQKQISGVQVFHFAGHAVAWPKRSGLMLSDFDPRVQRMRVVDGQSFTPEETRELQLAVLSACHTNAEAEPGTSGTESLAQALLHDGVPHVIVSRWNVDSSKTAELMKQFYSNVLGGEDVASALHGAQLALASQAASAHPYYWAAFELEGIK